MSKNSVPREILIDELRSARLLAVLRGVSPGEVVAVSDALIEAGIRVLEVTLDSPEPLTSIALLRDRHPGRAIVAAGTVLTPGDAKAAVRAGASLVVAPNLSTAVLTVAKVAGALTVPGVMTPTEAFTAIEAGADMLKLFPGDALGASGVKAIRAVLPSATPMMVTGGVDESTIPAFLNAGADMVGLGSALYSPGKSPAEVGEAAARFVAAAKGARA